MKNEDGIGTNWNLEKSGKWGTVFEVAVASGIGDVGGFFTWAGIIEKTCEKLQKISSCCCRFLFKSRNSRCILSVRIF